MIINLVFFTLRSAVHQQKLNIHILQYFTSLALHYSVCFNSFRFSEDILPSFEASFVLFYFDDGIERNNSELSIMQLNIMPNVAIYAEHVSSIRDIRE